MSDDFVRAEEKLSWRFPPTFWFANGAELCERAAYYGMFITLFRYLNTDIGFTDPQTGVVTALFAGGIYFLPTFMGIMADKIGFKQALLLAFALLTGGYSLLGAFQLKWTALLALALIMFGGAIIKPVISGTVAKCSDSDHRARAMSIFYMVVNIGSFSGKGLAGVLNEKLGLQYINFYAAGMTFTALLLVAIFYRNVDTEGVGKTVKEALRGLWTVMRNFRFLSLILIIAGFWLIQGQLYGAMPTFIERVLGKGYKPEWLANINPLTVVILVVPITHLIRRFRPENAIGIGLFIIPFTALVISLGPPIEAATGGAIDFGWFTMHPLILLVIIGIALQGLAECFLSPKFLEYASKQAPKGEVGLYLGYQHLTTFFAWLAGFVVAGILLDRYCPDPRKFDAQTRHEWRLATDATYQFTLPEALRTDLVEQTSLRPTLVQALREQGLDVPEDAALAELEPRQAWKSDPERKWRIEQPYYTVERIEDEEKAEPILRIHADTLSETGTGRRAPATFVLEDNLVKELGHDKPVSDSLRKALQTHGCAVPENATVREVWSHSGAKQRDAWRIAVPWYTIEESKLETDADARANGRTRALRDVLVHGNTPRSLKDMPRLPAVYDHAHRIWYVFTGIGFTAFLGLIVFKIVTNRIDRTRAAEA